MRILSYTSVGFSSIRVKRKTCLDKVHCLSAFKRSWSIKGGYKLRKWIYIYWYIELLNWQVGKNYNMYVLEYTLAPSTIPDINKTNLYIFIDLLAHISWVTAEDTCHVDHSFFLLISKTKWDNFESSNLISSQTRHRRISNNALLQTEFRKHNCYRQDWKLKH